MLINEFQCSLFQDTFNQLLVTLFVVLLEKSAHFLVLLLEVTNSQKKLSKLTKEVLQKIFLKKCVKYVSAVKIQKIYSFEENIFILDSKTRQKLLHLYVIRLPEMLLDIRYGVSGTFSRKLLVQNIKKGILSCHFPSQAQPWIIQ